MLQVVHQTREEKIKMYRKMKKKDLAEMLVNCHELLDAQQHRLGEKDGATSSTVIWNPNTINPQFSYTVHQEAQA